MKTIKKNDEIRRVNNETAHNLTSKGGWKYIAKSEWKETRSEKRKNRKK